MTELMCEHARQFRLVLDQVERALCDEDVPAGSSKCVDVWRLEDREPVCDVASWRFGRNYESYQVDVLVEFVIRGDAVAPGDSRCNAAADLDFLFRVDRQHGADRESGIRYFLSGLRDFSGSLFQTVFQTLRMRAVGRDRDQCACQDDDARVH